MTMRLIYSIKIYLVDCVGAFDLVYLFVFDEEPSIKLPKANPIIAPMGPPKDHPTEAPIHFAKLIN